MRELTDSFGPIEKILAYMNCSPKISKKLVVFEPKMVPLGFGTVLGVLDVRNREYWSILLHRKKSGLKILFYRGEN